MARLFAAGAHAVRRVHRPCRVTRAQDIEIGIAKALACTAAMIDSVTRFRAKGP